MEYSTVIDSVAASKGLLRNREDILALLNLSGTREDVRHSVSLLCQVVRIGSQKHLRISTLRGQTQNAITTRASTVTELLKYKLPRESSISAAYDLHPATGALYEHEGKQLRVYDLTGTVPKVFFDLGRKKTSLVNSFARIGEKFARSRHLFLAGSP